ncbi:MAG TPA: ABC transporter ATP-binding protein [Anaerolineales bacterium]|nr:ABC transporter ATP-binding protein [Anaerolineales bacterium]
MTDLAIKTEALRKEFGQQVAVRGLSLEVRRAEVFGFLGPNGAGKTTSIKMLLGLVAPTAGGGQLLGAPLGHRATRGRVGFLPEHFRFHDWLTAQEFLTLHGRLHGLQPAPLRKRIDDLLERVGLNPFRNKQLRTYSKGMLQRVGLAQALINAPELVFLDEPTSGLDPVGRRLVRDLIREVRDAGTTVFLNSHLLGEIEVTCDRVAFIQHGEVVRSESLRTLAEGEVQVTARGAGLTPAVLSGLEHWATAIRADLDQVTFVLPAGEAALPEIARYLTAQGVDLYALVPQRLSLEEIFIRTVGTEGVL